MKLTVETHYAPYNEEYGEGGIDGDYLDVCIKDEDGNILAEWGDHYHDKGSIRAEGWIQGYEYALNTYQPVELVVEHVQLVDREFP